MALASSNSEATSASDIETQQISITIDDPKNSNAGSEITVKEFLDFLKTAYQVSTFYFLSIGILR